MKRHDLELLDYLVIDLEPSFGPGERFAISPIYGDSTGQAKYLLKYDCCSGGKPEGKIEGKVQLSQSQVEPISAFCLNMNIPVMPGDSEMGCDGTTTKVTIAQGSNIVQIQWWEDAPEPWKSVERIVGMLRQIVKDTRTSR